MAVRGEIGQQSVSADLRPGASAGYGGVRSAAGVQTPSMDAQHRVIQGLAEFGSKEFRDAAAIKYNKAKIDGAMAYQQGQSAEDLPTGNNKWALEGYRLIQASTEAAEVLAAQKAEITNNMYSMGPEAFRAEYGKMVESSLQGMDPRTQDLMREQFVNAMPELVGEHTMAHENYLTQETQKSVVMSVDTLSRTPKGTEALLMVARGEGAAAALPADKRTDAVIDGVVTAYGNMNPGAYYTLKAEGVFDQLTPEQQSKLMSAKNTYEGRVQSEYNPVLVEALSEFERKLNNDELGEPDDVIKAYSDFWMKYGVEPDNQQLTSVYGAAEQADMLDTAALQTEIKTASLRGDYSKVADLSTAVADDVIRNGGGFTGSMVGEGNANAAVVTSGLQAGGLTSNAIGGILMNIQDESKFNPAIKGDGGNAQGIVQWNGPRMRALYAFADAAGADPTNLDLQVKFLLHELKTDYPGVLEKINNAGSPGEAGQIFVNEFERPAESHRAARHAKYAAYDGTAEKLDMPPIDASRWKAAVAYTKGDLELAAVVYSDGQEVADKWAAGGRQDDALSTTARTFQTSLIGKLSGRKYQTAQTRYAEAQAVYETVQQQVGSENLGKMLAKDREDDDAYLNGSISKDEYYARRKTNSEDYGIARSRDDYARQQSVVDKRITQDRQELDAGNLEAYKLDIVDSNARTQAAIDAVLATPKPDSMDPAVYERQQQKQIADITTRASNGIVASAARYGISTEDANISDQASRITKQVLDATEKARQYKADGIEIQKHVDGGYLDKATPALKERAVKDAMAGIDRNTEWYRTRPKEDGTMPTADEVAEFRETKLGDFYAKSGYVPEDVKQRMTGAMKSEWVGKDGVVNAATLGALDAYDTLRKRSPIAADKMLDPKERVIADALLDTTGGDPAMLKRAMVAVWMGGLGNAYMGQEVPAYTKQADVKAAVDAKIHGGALYNWTLGLMGSSAADDLGIDPQTANLLADEIKRNVDALATIAPGISTDMLVESAARNVLKKAVPIVPGPDASAKPVMLVDAGGKDVFVSMFGNKSEEYRADRKAVGRALTTYMASAEFKKRHKITAPQGTALDGIPILQRTPQDVAMGTGIPAFDVVGLTNGMISIEIQQGNGQVEPLVLPLSEIGEFTIQERKRVARNPNASTIIERGWGQYSTQARERDTGWYVDPEVEAARQKAVADQSSNGIVPDITQPFGA